MCLAIPVRVVALESEDTALVAMEGLTKRISVALLDDVAVGDYVLLHVGYALHKLSEDEARRTLALMAETGLLAETLDELREGEPA